MFKVNNKDTRTTPMAGFIKIPCISNDPIQNLLIMGGRRTSFVITQQLLENETLIQI